jgi:hypothetical protein
MIDEATMDFAVVPAKGRPLAEGFEALWTTKADDRSLLLLLIIHEITITCNIILCIFLPSF